LIPHVVRGQALLRRRPGGDNAARRHAHLYHAQLTDEAGMHFAIFGANRHDKGSKRKENRHGFDPRQASLGGGRHGLAYSSFRSRPRETFPYCIIRRSSARTPFRPFPAAETAIVAAREYAPVGVGAECRRTARCQLPPPRLVP